MEEKNISILSIERLQAIIREALRKFYGDDPERLKIHKADNRLNFSCPYCGDSKNPKKKRGNLYLSTLTYKCYNGGCEVFKNFKEFIKDFGIQDMLSMEEMEEISEASMNFERIRKIRNSIDYFFFENYKDILIPRDLFKEKLKLKEVKGTYAEKWLTERNHIPDKKFLWDPIKKSLYLLNLSGDETMILGLQIRPIIKSTYRKYFTYKLSGIYKHLLNITDQDTILKSEKIDPVSTVFGFSTVDLDSMVTVFEGPLDAWLYPNSIALCSINNPFPFDISNKRWFLDSDKAGRDKALELLQNGENVFLWKKFLEENDLPERDKWDLNDIVNYLRSTGKKIKRFDNYFSSDKLDIIYI